MSKIKRGFPSTRRTSFVSKVSFDIWMTKLLVFRARLDFSELLDDVDDSGVVELAAAGGH